MEESKTTVSVPDDLWATALDRNDGQGGSALVQNALRLMVSGCILTPTRQPDLDDETRALMHATESRLAAEKQQSFSKGYRMGVSLAANMNWVELSYVVEYELNSILETHFAWEGEDPNDELASGQHDAVMFERVAELFAVVASHFEEPADRRPLKEVCAGTEQALADLHDRVQRNDLP